MANIKLPLYQVDAFTSRVFSGNPAAVVLLDEWLPDRTLAASAAENNLAETACVVPCGDRVHMAGHAVEYLRGEITIEVC